MAPKRKTKRDPETFCLSHKEVYELVRKRQILTDDQLWDLAQKLSGKGDHCLLNYCSGSNGIKKRNLQATIDVIWMDEASAAKAASHGPDAVHCRILSAKQLDALKKRARNSVPVARLGTLGKVVDKKRPVGLMCIRDACLDAKMQSSGKEVLFDHLGHRAEMVFRPRCGIWRLRDFYELLVACQEEPDLQGAQPSLSAEGGFRFPRGESGWHAMLRAGVATPRIPFVELTHDQKAAASPEIRLGSACGSLCWNPAGPEAYKEWIEELPKDQSFEKDTLTNVAAEERLVHLWSKNHVEDRHWRALLQVLEACEHSVRQTTGFAMVKGVMQITGSAARSTKHKYGESKRTTFGIQAAKAAVEEESRKGSAGLRSAASCLMAGEARSADLCPEVAPKAKRARLSSIRDQPRLASIEDRPFMR
eukprot:TRINITY_DN4282_c0_g2_i1.p1 TRINITY_DN4282_c0_g2~~TRINITY_DN4282_c0_g2_i1.p1  ORF type:complete len:420 (-),score=91.60 TRINITY_DN4282_c0_g2_i1:137-1396(-)